MSTKDNYKDNVVAPQQWLTDEAIAEYLKQMDPVDMVKLFKRVTTERTETIKRQLKEHLKNNPKPMVRVRTGNDACQSDECELIAVNIKNSICKFPSGYKYNVPHTLCEVI